jgi:hypothetical protein
MEWKEDSLSRFPRSLGDSEIANKQRVFFGEKLGELEAVIWRSFAATHLSAMQSKERRQHSTTC